MTTTNGLAASGRAVALSVLLGMATHASAADGRIAINQSKAQAGKVTPGDTAGFPVTLTRPGSYVLTSNLTVPDSKDGIVIAANGVTIDLDGFGITGSVLANGIVDNDISRKGITIRNGTISGFNIAIRIIASTASVVQGIRAFDNYDFGIGVGSFSLVSGNVVSDSGYGAISVYCPSSVLGNAVHATIFLNGDGCTADNNSPAP